MTEVLKFISEAKNKGAFLELLVEDILKDDERLSNVRRQGGGSQFGFDLFATCKNSEGRNESWKYECKNLQAASTISDIAPKLIWHINDELSKFIIVSPFGLSNDLHYLLEKNKFYFSIEIWDGEYLEKRISNSPKARLRLGAIEFDINDDSQPLFFPASEVLVDIYCPYADKPFGFDYFLKKDQLYKAYSERFFYLTATLNNLTTSLLSINKIVIRTVEFYKPETRILRQSKFRGLVDPIELTFDLKGYPNGEISVLPEGKLLEVLPKQHEHLNLRVSEQTPPGYYEFAAEFSGKLGKRDFSSVSPVFALLIKGKDFNMKTLQVVGKYYDSPVRDILHLSNQMWDLLNSENSEWQYLGPTHLNSGDSDTSWKIYEIENDLPKELVDLKIPIIEELFSSSNFLNRTFEGS